MKSQLQRMQSASRQQIPGGVHLEIMIILMLLAAMLAYRNASAQEVTFDVFSGGTRYGTLSVTREHRGANLEYRLRADVTIRFVKKYSITEEISAIYQSGKMISCVSKRVVNGTVRNLETTEYKNGRYVTTSPHHSGSVIHEPVMKSILLLYLDEPRETGKVFSETHQRFIPLVINNEGDYLLNLPGGQTTAFRYRNGQCVAVQSTYRFLNAEFIRRNDAPKRVDIPVEPAIHQRLTMK